MTTRYNRRTWLNPTTSEATGSVVAFDGDVRRRAGADLESVSLLEIADCHTKIGLHRLPDDSVQDFIRKLRLLAREVNLFADFLENHKPEASNGVV